MKTVSANSNPTESMIDTYRLMAYTKIGEIVGHGAADSNNVYKVIEMSAVGRKIEAIQNRQIYSIILLQEEKDTLKNAADAFGASCWEPDKDSAISGSG